MKIIEFQALHLTSDGDQMHIRREERTGVVVVLFCRRLFLVMCHLFRWLQTEVRWKIATGGPQGLSY